MQTLFERLFSGRRKQEFWVALLMGGPAFLLLIMFMIWPFLNGIRLSRTNQQFNSTTGDVVGGRNYDNLLSLNIAELPDVPDDLPTDEDLSNRERILEGVWWYADEEGNAEFAEFNLNNVLDAPEGTYELLNIFTYGFGNRIPPETTLFTEGLLYSGDRLNYLRYSNVKKSGGMYLGTVASGADDFRQAAEANLALVQNTDGVRADDLLTAELVYLPPEWADLEVWGEDELRKVYEYTVLDRTYGVFVEEYDYWQAQLDLQRSTTDPDNLIGVAILRNPGPTRNLLTPEEVEELREPIWWYENSQGDLLFKWYPANLEEVGLEEFDDYPIDAVWIRFEFRGKQYAIIAKDKDFYIALRNNLYFALVVVPVQTALALLMAMLVNQKLAGMEVYRTIYFSPVVTAMVIITIVWKWLYNYDANLPQLNGLINQFLDSISGGRVGPYDWLGDPKLAMPSIMIMSIWQGVGFQMIIFLAGLQDIPEEMYEAASIDGAGIFAKFRFITLPMLRNTMIFVVLTTTILAFRLYDQVNVLVQRGAHEDSIKTMVWLALKRGREQNRIGEGAAISVVFVLIVLFVSLIQRTVVRSESAIDR
ncbi:MAG: sugar ABC transporter permease [Chloroflexi bacterium]|nr:sugar ABC transporter permease [Chloroflexota bacterium]